MIKINQNNSQRVYSSMHFLYLMIYALMFAYASTYLQDKGFSNTEIGIVLGCSFVLASFCGGMILDASGAGVMLLCAAITSIVGTGIFAAYFIKIKKA